MLSDSILDAIENLLIAVDHYDDYSDEFRQHIISNITDLYCTWEKIFTAGLPEDAFKRRSRKFWKKHATARFNHSLNGRCMTECDSDCEFKS